MKKILIIGPFKDKGGRELEISFIANALSGKYAVDIISTDDMTTSSEVHKSYNKGHVTSLKEILYNSSLVFRIFSFFAYIKNDKKKNIYNYVNNAINKRFRYKEKNVFVLEKRILQYDVVFINAQLKSNYVEEIVNFAFKNKKHILFRTSGTIYNSQINLNYLNKVSLFIHHSEKNAVKIEKRSKEHIIIDQCSFIEEKLLAIPLSEKSKNFVIIGRLAKDKGINELISFFITYSNPDLCLHIYGDGELENMLIDKYKKHTNIKFMGYILPQKIHEVLAQNDCLIIPSFNEGGPLVGIEAMAAGKLILSTDVGAMKERLIGTNNDFWFDINDYDSFKTAMDRLLNKNLEERLLIGSNLKNRYLERYSSQNISNNYMNVLERFIQ